MKNYACFALTLCIGLTANAQKLQNVQTGGVYAPANFKADGKPTEWGEFQAYNKTSSVFYTLANDADNLILAVHTTYDAATDKILRNKFSLTIKGKNGSIKLTTPNANIRSSRILSRPETLVNDSLYAELTQQIKSFKQIEVTGIVGITTPTIPIYNEYGITMAMRVEKDKSYTCEMVIPLKHLSQILDGTDSFNYIIKINGRKMPEKGVRMGADGKIKLVANSEFPIPPGEKLDGFPMMEAISEAEIPGTYTLVKK
jgi:hypothetical protein